MKQISNSPVKPGKSIHTSRTVMFAELAKVMDHGIENDNYVDSLNQNVINKATQSGVSKTSRYLIRLYGFDGQSPYFKALKYFWQISEEKDKPILALLFAIGNDYHLAGSISVLSDTQIGEKVTIETLEENIEALYPLNYTKTTRRSIAKNIASSWKQAGFITGKIKNLRTQPDINYLVVAFAFLLAYLNDVRGDFILKSNWVKALSLDDNKIRSLAIEAGKRDLLQYQFSGNVTSITFNNLLNKLNINGIEN